MNDEESKRAYGSRTDAYAVFRAMLDKGNPTDSFDALYLIAKGTVARLQTALKSAAED